MLHVVVGINVAAPWKHVPDLLGFKGIHIFAKALPSKVCLLNFHKRNKSCLMAIFCFLFASQFNTIMNKTQYLCQDTLDRLGAATAGSSSLLGLERGADD